MRQSLSDRLPDFPWDTLAGAKAKASTHPDGIVDLSVGTPVDPTPELGIRALSEAADWPGYPLTIGTPALRQAIVDYLTGRWGAEGLGEDAVLPVIGTKELVANLPLLLGLGANDTIVIPEVAYPTYLVGAQIAGATAVPCDDPASAPDASLVWINYPANPHGAIADPALLRDWVAWAREHDAILASDECYGEFGWDAEPTSVLHPSVCGDSHANVLVAGSLSKRSNLAGYRAGFVAGDKALVGELREVRKHMGFLMPGPVQAAMAALLADQDHVNEQRERYLARRAVLRPALEAAGFTIDHSEGSLYLWATRGENCRDTIDWLAERGILAAPGDFYGAKGEKHVRIALTASDERIAAAAERLTA